MEALPVTLIVKAPNQQFEDQTIKCEPTWSIRKLKGYLSEVYPCNPSLEEQKLIYSGQLLNDAHILKDVLRKYEGQDTHTVHLVYTPKNGHPVTSPKSSQPAGKDVTKNSTQPQSRQQSSQQSQQTEPTIGSDGLRHRNAGTGSNAGQLPSPPPFMTGFLNAPQPFMPGMSFAQPNPNQPQPQYTPEQYALAQQMAMQNMMQQMYLQYMNQYASAMQQSNNAGTPNVPYFPNYFPQNNFGMPQQFTATNTNAPNLNSDQQGQQQQQQPDGPPVAPAPRFQAAAAGGADDEVENRDWLEILYTLSRLLVLLSLVYFYSSPGRCSIVIIVIVLYYFYQNHQRNLRERQQQMERLQEAAIEPDVVEIPTENTEQPNATEANGENQRNEGESTPLINSDTDSPASTSTSSDEQDENRLPTITLLRTFILSFFSSLIPETPAV